MTDLNAIEAALLSRNGKSEGTEIRFRCPRPELHKNGDNNPSCRFNVVKRLAFCDVCNFKANEKQLAAALGIQLPNDRKNTSARRIATTYDYKDEKGTVLYQVVRYEPKDFSQRRPDGKGGWINKLKDVRRVLYRLPELLSSADKIVLILEGEKDVETGRSLGMNATCNSGGADKWRKEYNESLRGKRCVVIPDRDSAGQQHARKVAASLHASGIPVHILELPGDGVKDLSDWAAAGGTKEALEGLIEKAPPFTPGSSDEVKNEPEESGRFLPDLDHALVLGEMDGEILLYDQRMLRLIRCSELRMIDLPTLVRYFGPEVMRLVRDGRAEEGDERPTIKKVKCLIAANAYRRPLAVQRTFGQGIWLADEHHLLVVCGGQLRMWNGHVATVVPSPILANGIALPEAAMQWDDVDTVAKIASEMTPPKAQEIFQRLLSIIEHWTTRFPEDPAIISALIVASFIQSIWGWRPQVSVTGRYSTGKSKLAEFIAEVIGRLACLRDGKLTEAAMRQELKRDLRVPLLDEFEKNPHREAILQLIRMSGRGGEASRGTRDHKPINFALRHIIWTFSIDAGLRHAADRSRFITLELLEPKAKSDPVTLNSTEIRSLGQHLRAVALWLALPARELEKRLAQTEVPGLARRQVENLAVPQAVLSAIYSFSEEESRQALVAYGIQYASAESESGDLVSDEERLLEAIAGITLRVDETEPGENHDSIVYRGLAVSQLLGNEGQHRILEANGIALRQDGIFLSTEMLLKILPQEWRNIDIRRILLRVPEAKSTKRQIAGRQTRGVLVPSRALYVEPVNDGVPLGVPPQAIDTPRDSF